MPNVPGDEIHIIEFFFSWTQPTPSYYRFATPVLEVVIPFESLLSSTDIAMSFADFDSSSKDTDTASPTLMYPHSMLPEAWVLPEVDLVSENEGEDSEEDTSYEEDPFMDKEDPATEPEIMEEDSLQDSFEESY